MAVEWLDWLPRGQAPARSLPSAQRPATVRTPVFGQPDFVWLHPPLDTYRGRPLPRAPQPAVSRIFVFSPTGGTTYLWHQPRDSYRGRPLPRAWPHLTVVPPQPPVPWITPRDRYVGRPLPAAPRGFSVVAPLLPIVAPSFNPAHLAWQPRDRYAGRPRPSGRRDRTILDPVLPINPAFLTWLPHGRRQPLTLPGARPGFFTFIPFPPFAPPPYDPRPLAWLPSVRQPSRQLTVGRLGAWVIDPKTPPPPPAGTLLVAEFLFVSDGQVRLFLPDVAARQFVSDGQLRLFIPDLAPRAFTVAASQRRFP